MLIHWRRTDALGTNIDEFSAAVAALPAGQLWRHNQAGDLPGDGRVIDREQLDKIVVANTGKRGFTYTHYTPDADNAEPIADANKRGFTINLSADSLTEADALYAKGIAPVVTLLPIAQRKNTATPAGHKVVVCPAVIKENVTCSSCKLCANLDRGVIIGFPAHGSRKKTAEAVHTLAA